MLTLTDNERAAIVVGLDGLGSNGLGSRAVRCIDERDARIAELESACERVRATALRLINDRTPLGPFLGQQMLNDLEGK
jgi:hypothetical protein